MPQKAHMIMEETVRTSSDERIRMIRELRTNHCNLENDSIEISEQLVAFTSKFNDLEMTVETVDQINEIYAKLQKLGEEQERSMSMRDCLNLNGFLAEFCKKFLEDFTPLHLLWNLASE